VTSAAEFAPAADILDKSKQGFWSRITPPKHEPQRDWLEFQSMVLLNTFLNIVNTLKSYGHGGTLLLVEPDVIGRMPVRVKYEANHEAIFLGTPEYFNHAPLVPGVGGGPATDQTFVKALYLQLLQRPADPGEVNFWGSQIPALGRTGVALAILGSGEYRGNVVHSDYAALHRLTPPSPAEVAGWVNSGLDLGRIRASFEATLEFFLNG
jgi:hypothetical protein